MRPHDLSLFLILSLVSVTAEDSGFGRRILHQPLFPESLSPPPATKSDVFPTPDQPFFPEVPGGGADQVQSTAAATEVNEAEKPTKAVAIGVSVGIVTLGMLCGLLFFLYRQRVKLPGETQKLVGGGEDSGGQPASFLYIGTVEPPGRRSVGESNASPYHKLSSAKRSDRYRPSPELQPLPPLTNPIRNFSPAGDSSPASSGEESQDSAFYTPQGSSASNEDEFFTRRSRLVSGRRVSQKPRLSGSSPPPRTAAPPPLPPQPHHQQTRFLTPPPLPNWALLKSKSNSSQSAPPPPPPPPPPPLAAAAMPTSPKLDSIVSNESKTPKPSKPIEETEKIEKIGFSLRTDHTEAKPRLKPLHWDKVRATSDRATVWDQLKSSSFQLNEDMMESLFGCSTMNSASGEPIRRSVLPPVEKENRVLDPKKSQNIAILLRALNVTQNEVSAALMDGDPESLGVELLESLVKMAPTKEEEIKLRDYTGDVSKLGSAERFLKAVLDIPFAFRRVEAMLYRGNFDSEVKYLRNSFQTLEVASEELKNSRLFLKLLEAVLRAGNRMNVGTNRGDATSFKLETLLKLVDVKGTDGKTTLLHFVVQEVIRTEGDDTDSTNLTSQNKFPPKAKEDGFRKQGLQVVAGLGRDLINVKKAAGMDSDVLSTYVTKLAMGLEKVRLVLQHEKTNPNEKFFESMKLFLKEAKEEINHIKADESKALSLVKDVTQYFHGNAAREEAHPLRIFIIVKDFLSILDNVCKEVGRIQDRTMAGSARSFRLPVTASLPVLNRYNVRKDTSSDEESSSP